METNAKDTGRNQNLIHQLHKVGGEKHWLQKELLDLRGSARKQIETNQSGRDANLSMRRELGHTGIESDRLGVELLRSKAESERFDQELRGAQDTIHSWDDSTFHIPEPASGASGEPALCDTVRTLGRKEGSPGSHGVSPILSAQLPNVTDTPPHAAVSTSASTAAASFFAQRSNNRSVARVGSDPVSGGPHPASVSPSPFQSLFSLFRHLQNLREA